MQAAWHEFSCRLKVLVAAGVHPKMLEMATSERESASRLEAAWGRHLEGMRRKDIKAQSESSAEIARLQDDKRQDYVKYRQDLRKWFADKYSLRFEEY